MRTEQRQAYTVDYTGKTAALEQALHRLPSVVAVYTNTNEHSVNGQLLVKLTYTDDITLRELTNNLENMSKLDSVQIH